MAAAIPAGQSCNEVSDGRVGRAAGPAPADMSCSGKPIPGIGGALKQRVPPVRPAARRGSKRFAACGCLAAGLLIGLQSGTALAQQGAPAPIWERQYGRWSVALLPGGARCAMFGRSRDNAYRIQVAANRRGPKLAFIELVGNAGDMHVSLQPGQEVRLVADGRSDVLRVSSTFRASLIATFVATFDPSVARAGRVEIDTGHPARLLLDGEGLAQAGGTMADCLAGHLPKT